MSDMYNELALSLPGHWIEHTDRDFAWTAHQLLSLAVDQYKEAVVACGLFRPLTFEEVHCDPDRVDTQSRAYESILRSLYAKAYVYALDAVRACVAAICDQPESSEQTKKACADFHQAFGYIRDVRNSLQHIEERIQGIGPGRKQIQTPILSLSSFGGERRFGVTSGQGLYVEIEISEGYLAAFRLKLTRVIWSFDWIGPGNQRILPSETSPIS